MKGFILAVICLLGILLIMSVPAPAQTRSAEQFVLDLVDDAKIMQELQKSGHYGGLRYVVQHNFDIRRMGRFALGRHWRKATIEQQNKFLELFELVSMQRFGPILNDISFGTFRIISMDYKNIDTVLVVSTVEHKNKTVRIQWRLQTNYLPEYRVVDITAAGISLMLTLRAEYGEVVKEYGIEGLISRLEDAIQTN